MEVSGENTITNSTEKYSFLDQIGEPVPKSKLIGKRVCDIIFGRL
ncbi:YjbD family protein [Limosilactobacillus fermentum]|nr:YjbD family protein [Limosilactobacillus fermentum]UVZ02381.1 YjbD family protein [Limosilactobacillus fermentum]